MPDRDLDKLRTQLLESGVLPGHVARLVSELSDHYDDLEADAMRDGLSREAARKRAAARMGDTTLIVEHVLCEPELKCWFYRYPRLARVAMPMAYCLLLPAAPFFAGVAHAPAIGRWLACLTLSGLVTATMFLLMQIAIVLT